MTDRDELPAKSQKQSTFFAIWWNPALLITVVVIVTGIILLTQGPEKIQTPEPEKIVNTQADALLTRANQARQAGHYIEPEDDNALQFYLRLLTLEPTSKEAREGVEDIVKRYNNRVRSDLAGSRFDKAGRDLQRLLAAMPDSEKWVELQAELDEAQYNHSRLLQLLAQVDEYLKQNNLLSPIGNNALSTLRKVLELDPDNREALQRIEIIFFHYIRQAEKEISEGKLTAARKSIRNSKLVDASHPEIARINRLFVSAKAEKTATMGSSFLSG